MDNTLPNIPEILVPQINPLQFESCQFVLDREGKIVAFDPQMADKLGIPPTDPRGFTLRALLVELNPDWQDTLPHNFWDNEEPLFLSWERGDNPFSVGLALNRLPAGEQLFVTLSPDLASQEKLQNASVADYVPQPEVVARLFLRLQQSESRLNNYMQNFPGYFFCQRPDLSFTSIDPKFEEVIHQPVKTWLKNGGAFLESIYDKDRNFFLNELDRNSRRAKTFSLSYRIRKGGRGGILYLMEVRTPLYTTTGLLFGYEGVWLDISRQSIAENRLTSTSWKENLATITSGLVHDFSNIMAGIHSLSELYHERLEPSNTMYAGMAQIKKNSMQAQKLVRRIIDLNRDQTGFRDYHNLENLIRDQIDLIRIILPRVIEIETEFTEQELPIYADDIAFRQMLLNLALNARDAFTEDQMGKLRICVRKVEAGQTVFAETLAGEYQTDKPSAEIIFEDNGCGIAEAHLNKVFAPFFTTKEALKGSGFGLYNAKLFMENHRGRITVRSELGKGTAFHILLPLADFTEMEYEAQDQDNDPLFNYNKGRPSFAVYASHDPSAFELISHLRQKEWEVITFDRIAKIKSYFKETDFLPHVLFAIDVGHDHEIETMLDYMSEEYPGIKVAVQILGRNPDEHEDLKGKAELLFGENDMNQDIVVKLQELIN